MTTATPTGATGVRPTLRRWERAVSRWAPLWPLTALSLGLDILLRTERITGWGALAWYLGTCVFSVALWTWAYDLSLRLRPRAPRGVDVAVGVFSFLAALLTVISLGFHAEFHTWPTTYALVHAVNEPAESIGYVLGPLLGLPLLGVAALCAAYAALWISRLRTDRTPSPRARLWVSGLCAVGSIVSYGYVHRFAPFMLPDATAAKVVLDTVVNQVAGGVRGRLLAANRPELGKVSPKAPQPNIIFIVGESLPSTHMSVYGYSKDTTPLLKRWIDDRGASGVVFDKAMANSSVTKVSLPSMMTGLYPSRPPFELHTYPLLWNYAKAAGYQTALVTAQSYAWNNLEGFFIDGSLDHVFTLETSKNPVANSTGMDDALMMTEAIRTLERFKQGDAPIFLTLQFNGTHHPGHWHPEHAKFEEGSHPLWKRDNAIHCMDVELGRLREALKRLELEDSTFVLLTSDHGDLDLEHKIHRSESYYQLTLAVPLLVWTPTSFAKTRGQALEELAKNRSHRVSLADVTPTLVDAMGVHDAVELEQWVRKLDGRSLLRPLSADRTIVAVNTDEHLRWSRQGFAVVRGDTKLVYYSWVGPQLFDLAKDPEERHGLWQEQSHAAERQELLSIVQQDATLRSIYQQH